MRTWGLVGVLCLCASAVAQEQRITLTVHGATPRNAVAQIADLTGEKLEVADNVNLCTLVLRLTDVTLEDALSRIADVTEGYWADVGDKRILRLDTRKERRQRTATRERRLKAIQEQVEEAIENLEPWGKFQARMEAYANSIAELGSQPWAKEDQQQIIDLRERGAGTRLAVKLSGLFDMNDVFDLPQQSRVVYSNRPTNMQRKLPSGSDAAIAQFLIEFEAWKRAVVPTLLDHPVQFHSDLRNYIDRSTQPPGHVLLEVRRDDSAQSLRFNLFAYDDRGQEIESGFCRYRFSLAPEDTQYEFKSVELSDDDLAYTDFINSLLKTTLPDGSPMEGAAKKWLDRYTDCATDEPLSWLPGRALVKSVEAAGDDLVALIPDLALNDFVTFDSSWKKDLSGPDLGSRIVNAWQCSVEYEGGCVTISPREPSVSRSNYIRREPLEVLMRALQRDGTLTVVEAARYAYEQVGELSFRGIERWFVMSVIPIGSNYRPSNLLTYAQSALRFLGSLDSDEYSLARSDSGLSLGMMKPGSVAALNAWLFYRSDRVYGLHHSRHSYPEVGEWKFDTPVWIERTASSALPDGVPPDTTIRVRIEDEPMLFVKAPSARFASSEKLDSFANVAPITGGESSLFQPAELTVFHIELSFGKDVTADYTLEQVPALRKDWSTLVQLSEQLRSYITEIIQSAQKARAEYERSRSQQNPPPAQ